MYEFDNTKGQNAYDLNLDADKEKHFAAIAKKEVFKDKYKDLIDEYERNDESNVKADYEAFLRRLKRLKDTKVVVYNNDWNIVERQTVSAVRVKGLHAELVFSEEFDDYCGQSIPLFPENPLKKMFCIAAILKRDAGGKESFIYLNLGLPTSYTQLSGLDEYVLQKMYFSDFGKVLDKQNKE
ncbi:MAG: hypothetical protein FWE53_05120 [Firmicutes bacterium]|nr:hypothetical protein [Bacillota bacterium]